MDRNNSLELLSLLFQQIYNKNNQEIIENALIVFTVFSPTDSVLGPYGPRFESQKGPSHPGLTLGGTDQRPPRPRHRRADALRESPASSLHDFALVIHTYV